MRAVSHASGSKTAILQPNVPTAFEEGSADAPPDRVEATIDTATRGAFEDCIEERNGHQTASRRKRCGSPGDTWCTMLAPAGPDSMSTFAV